jgi:hypothetical protein
LARHSLGKSQVTVRIIVDEKPGVREIRVDGRLTAAEVEELEHAIDCPAATRLALANLRSADDVAVAALRRLRRLGVAMHGVRPNLAWRIESDDEEEPR